MSAVLLGKDFKAVVRAVAKFAGIGAFAGSELVNLLAVNGNLIATTAGIVLSRAKVPAEGTLPLIAVNERELGDFAGICPDLAKVTIDVGKTEVRVRFKNRELTTILVEGRTFKMPVTKEIPGVEITKPIAARVSYLSEIAFNDSSRADLSCVMLTTSGQIIAMNQKTLAVLQASPVKRGNVAIPVPLAKALGVGDVLYVGAKETALRSGIALYSMPSPVKAQKEFPLTTIKQFAKLDRTEVAVVEASKLATAITECASCLGQTSRSEIVVHLNIAGGKLELSAKAGGAKFRTVFSLLGKDLGEAKFRVPLEGIVHVAAFLGKKVTLSSGQHSELFLNVDSGWIMFSGWEEKKKK